jgi:hypothetical protein
MIEPMQGRSPPSQGWQLTKAASCVVLSTARRLNENSQPPADGDTKKKKLFSLAQETQRVCEFFE